MSARPFYDREALRETWRAGGGELIRLPRGAWTMPFDTLLSELEARGATGFIDREVSMLFSPRGLKNSKRAVLTLLGNIPQDEDFWFKILLNAVRLRTSGMPCAASPASPASAASAAAQAAQAPLIFVHTPHTQSN